MTDQAQNRRAFLEHFKRVRQRHHHSVVIYDELRSFICERYNLSPGYRFEHGELRGRCIDLFGLWVGHALGNQPLKSVSYTALEHMLTEPRPEDQHEIETPKPAWDPPPDSNAAQFYREQQDTDEQRAARDAFIAYLEGREGPCNPARTYRRWLRETLGNNYPSHVRILQDGIKRLGRPAGVYIRECRHTTRRALARYLRNL